MFETGNREKGFKEIQRTQHTGSGKQEVQIQKLSLAYMIIGVAALTGLAFLVITDSDMLYKFPDYAVNPNTDDPASVILWVFGAWFLVLLAFLAAVLAVVMFAAYWVVGIVISILLRKKLQKGTDYRKTGIVFGIWASILIVPLIDDVISRLKSFFNICLGAGIDVIPENIFHNLNAGEAAMFVITYIMAIAPVVIGISVLAIIYRDRKNAGTAAPPPEEAAGGNADIC